MKCEDPPSRASLRYWDYLERCGCEGIARPSQASNDYARFEAICGAERESTCGAPPSQASLGYWDYLKRCGCEGVFPPSTASNDYARFKTICGVASPID